jgi:chorismate-pyruvate lyase
MSAADKHISEHSTQPPADVDSALWHADMDDCGYPDPTLSSWLAENGLLTARLKSCCDSRFNMRVLRNQSCTSTERLHREVLLCCDNQACIYAITDVPAATLSAHKWLAELGDEPLGETLQTHADVTRSNFEYALLNNSSIPAAGNGNSQAIAWARKSSFYIGAEALTVIEVFLDGLRNCGTETS